MRWMILGYMALAGCSQQPRTPKTDVVTVEATPAPADTVPPPAGVPRKAAVSGSSPDDLYYAGHWVGVEGMTLDIVPTGTARFRLTMQWDLDHRGSFVGRRHGGEPAASYIVFERDGRSETLRPTDGAATGLKYLAGKKQCLTVKPGEGYCRD